MGAVVVPFWMKENLKILNHLTELVGAVGDEADCIYVVCNRLHMISDVELFEVLREKSKVRVVVLYEPGVERSVAGAWNHGMRRAIMDGHQAFVVAGVDTVPDKGTVQKLLNLATFSQAHIGGVISGVAHGADDPPDDVESCDFAFFCLSLETIHRHGWFDAHYKPAYFEDNDYYTRVILAGGIATQVKNAKFYHHGSLTIKMEPEAAHHVKHWFEANRARYKAKWGIDVVDGGVVELMTKCYLHPWNDPNLPLTFWERP